MGAMGVGALWVWVAKGAGPKGAGVGAGAWEFLWVRVWVWLRQPVGFKFQRINLLQAVHFIETLRPCNFSFTLSGVRKDVIPVILAMDCMMEG